jgi:predicted nicotinamide N-methyase
VSPTERAILTYAAPGLGEIYIEEQPALLVSGGTTGLRTWEGSLLLSEWIIQQQDMAGKRVLELGAGTGLAAIIAAKRGANVVGTDGSETVILQLQSNFTLNNVDVDTETLWFGDHRPILNEYWDYVVGADITYDDEIAETLAVTFSLALRNGGTGVLAATVRNVETLKLFEENCST